MTTKYAVYNPHTGLNDMYETKEEALQAFWLIAINFVIPMVHNTAYMTVQVNEDGSETWFNDSEQEIQRPLTPEEIQTLVKRRFTTASGSIDVAVVE